MTLPPTSGDLPSLLPQLRHREIEVSAHPLHLLHKQTNTERGREREKKEKERERKKKKRERHTSNANIN